MSSPSTPPASPEVHAQVQPITTDPTSLANSLEATEATPLLLPSRSRDRHGSGYKADRARSSSARRKLPWYKRPHPGWLLPYSILSIVLTGAAVPMEMSLLNQIACRAVEREGGLGPIVVRPPVINAPSYTPAEMYYTPSSAFAPGTTWLARLKPAPTSDRGPEWEAHCRASGAVAKKLASNMTIMLLLSGIATSLTTSFWGSMSDRVGRKPLLLLNTFSSIANPVASVMIYLFPERFAIGTLVSAMTFAGLLGGDIMSMSVTTAYFSDSTPEGSKTGILSLTSGLFFVGASIGPIVGSAGLRLTGILILPYIGIVVIQAVQALALVTIIPESLSPGRMRTERLRRTQAQREANAASRAEAAKWRSEGKSIVALHIRRVGRKMFSVLEPMAVLLPPLIEKDGQRKAGVEPAALAPKRRYRPGRRDWNLFLVALCYGLQLCVAGLGPVKLLYSQHAFDWGPEMIGFYVTFTSVTKLAVLLFVLPLGIKLFKPNAPLPKRPRPTSEASLQASDARAALEELTAAQKAWDEEAAQLKLVSDSHFDLKIARVSVLIAMASYLILGMPSSHEASFLFGIACVSLASGDIPALTSLGLSLASPADSGRVLASLGVLSSLVSQVVGPPVFSAIYIRTVDYFPTFCFVVAAGWFAAAYIPAMLINLHDDKMDDEQGVAEPLLAH